MKREGDALMETHDRKSSRELPEGWATTRLGDLTFDIQPGFACGEHNREGEGYPHLRPMNVSIDGKINLNVVKFIPLLKVDSDTKKLNFGDILFNNTNSTELVGKTAFYGLKELRAFSNHMTRIRCNSNILDSRYCALYLHELWRIGYFGEHCNKHISQSSISRNVLNETPIIFPPLAEQRRIVAAVEALLTQVNASRERLDNVPGLLKAFRQAVLAAACSGRLTEGWRESLSEYEKSDELLKRIRNQRKEEWKSTVQNIKKGINKQYPEPELPETDNLFEIPLNWSWGSLDQIVKENKPILYGILKPGPDIPNGIPYVRVNEMDDGKYIDSSSLRRTTIEIASKYKRSTLNPEDLLISKDGTIGKVSIVPSNLAGGNINQHIVRAAIHPFLNKNYIIYVLQAQFSQKWLQDHKKGVALQGVNVEDFRRLPIPLPPSPEQHEIVHRVEALFSLADRIEQRVAFGREKADRLTQAILAKAFRGELVPTEAELARREGRSYEPASVLLERIRAEKVNEIVKDNRG
jgi:type I restriction enzyme S subunit